MSIRQQNGRHADQRDGLANLLDRLETLADELTSASPVATASLARDEARPERCTLVNDYRNTNDLMDLQLARLAGLVEQIGAGLLANPEDTQAASGRGAPSNSPY